MRNHLITQLHMGYFGSLFSYALALTQDETNASDLVSEVFLKICNLPEGKLNDLVQNQWEFEEQLIEHDQTLGYLKLILKRTLIDKFRKKGTRNKNEAFYSNVIKISNGSTPEDIYISKEAVEKIFDVIDDLFRESNVDKSMSFWLKYQGYKSKDIAKMLNIPENTVSTNVRRMRLELKSKISIAQ